MLGVLYCGH